MILSRTLAKWRIAAGLRPGWLAAWGPVAVDSVAILAVLPVVQVTVGPQLSGGALWVGVVWGFFVFLLPFQIVFGVSIAYAVMSREAPHEDDAADPGA